MNPRRSRLLSSGFFALLCCVIVGGFLIARAAQQAVLESQAGSVAEYSLDPDEPGFRAFTESTPTALVLHTAVLPGLGADLVGVTLLTAAGEQRGGTVVTIPATMVNPDGTDIPLRNLFRSQGLDAVTGEIRSVLGIGFSDVVVLDASSWTTLMTADLPLQLTVREPLTEIAADGSTRFLLDAGTREFSLTEVARLAAHRNPNEPSLQVALRHQRIWQSWISRTAGADERPALFSASSGFVELLNSLANSEVAYRVLPMSTVPTESARSTRYEPSSEQVGSLIAQIVPVPAPSSIGDRPTVLLLDTSFGEVDEVSVLSRIAQAGGLVTILGNSEANAERTTEVQVHDPTAAEVAGQIAAALGLDAATSVPIEGSTTAITVIIG